MRPLLAICCTVIALTLTGCVGSQAQASAPTGVWGYVAGSERTELEVPKRQIGAEALRVDRVKTPVDSWLVVTSSDPRLGGVVRSGLLAVKAGESRDLEIPLKHLASADVTVTLFADRGEAGKFDVDPMDVTGSPDRPLFVDERPVETSVTLRDAPTIDVEAASVEVKDQPGAKQSIMIDRVVTPEPTWIAVFLAEDGKPSARVGLQHVDAGERRNVEVALEPFKLTPELFVTLVTDRGVPLSYEYLYDNTYGSPDRPIAVDGRLVSTRVSIAR